MSNIGILFCLIVLAEWYFWHYWNLLYFRTGLLLYKETFSSESELMSIAKSIRMKNIGAEAIHGKLKFKKISDNEIIVRKKRYLNWPVRGKFVFHEESSKIKVHVYINWYAFYVYLFVAIDISKEILNHPIPVSAGLIGWTIAMFLYSINSLLKEIGITKFDPW